MDEVSLDDIENVSEGDLDQGRLDTLQNGYSPFDDVLRSWSDPITLDRTNGIPYEIIDGRHRIYLARSMGYSTVPAMLEGDDPDGDDNP